MVLLNSSGEFLRHRKPERTEDGLLVVDLNHPEAAKVGINSQFGRPATFEIPPSGFLGKIQLESIGKLVATVPELLGGRVKATVALIGPDGAFYNWSGQSIDAPEEIHGFKGNVHGSMLAPGSWRITVTTQDDRSWSATATVVAEEVVEVTLRREAKVGA